jgi:hypothetical protein
MADTAGNLNFEFWEGDGKQTVFPISDAASRPVLVLEGADVCAVVRYGVDAGFRWSYDETHNALIVDGDPPAEGVIISYSYEPKPHAPVEGEEWTTITFTPE